ncbi:xanthine dehydrogenase family Fe-S subunit [Mesorhizobium sp. CO1-1-8]|uniref:xanthine dehydrogenase family Fe-S subunit n=1 Tax=Mesorhizobium sp. CO1-1-8 TaxID=2876631 RepID=UPI001CD18E1D|nr:2Fe-2S iron-sulfur cluster-binding protein [Mesorhizobium sp. CO1-1-8]MBZ9772583.1 2Fe-2S iron-sulfur cluster binding domain-containing protein [Mesorhizobium sp. CO1-1-8]
MTTHTVRLTVNQKPVTATVEARTQLVDLLREDLLLTGTHIGCEHGVCGACTVHIDNVPARSCITFAVACQGSAIRTIEDFDDDEVMKQLRSAFSREHALQCGYCTPGMLATSRDIVRRLPDADLKRIRIELSGNLCRCTGYSGIVRAVHSVLEERRRTGAATTLDRSAIGPAGSGHAGTVSVSGGMNHRTPEAKTPEPSAAQRITTSASGRLSNTPNIRIQQSFVVNSPRDQVWAMFENLEEVISCMPGAALTEPPQDDRLVGHIRIAMGPIKATFRGQAEIERDPAAYIGVIRGSGNEERGSSTSGELRYALLVGGERSTRVEVEIAAAIKGPLAHFSRSSLVTQLAARLTQGFSDNLAARLRGETSTGTAGADLKVGSLFIDAIRGYLKKMLGFWR